MGFVETQMTKKKDQETKYDKLVEVSDASYDDWYKRWVFMLSVGNGAAMLALAGSVLETDKNKFLLVSAWSFLLGLLCAGFAPYVMARSFRAQASYYFGMGRMVQGNPKSKMLENGETTTLEKWTYSSNSERRKFLRVVDVLVMMSSGFFVVGCVVGLVLIGQQ